MAQSHAISSIQLETFKSRFLLFKNQYVLIGGIASQLLLEEVGITTRSTKDLDIVLCIEALTNNFILHFWKFIKDGGYECFIKSGDKRCFYRFDNPKNPNYPYMLELLSDKTIQMEDIDQVTHPIVIDDELVSLSAIMLNQEYYQFIMQNKREIKGIMVVNEIAIIPLKIFAYLNLSDKKAKGEKISSDDINKHKNDVYRLVQLLSKSPLSNIPPIIKQDIAKFCMTLEEHPTILKQLHLDFESIDEIRNILLNVYCSE